MLFTFAILEMDLYCIWAYYIAFNAHFEYKICAFCNHYCKCNCLVDFFDHKFFILGVLYTMWYRIVTTELSGTFKIACKTTPYPVEVLSYSTYYTN